MPDPHSAEPSFVVSPRPVSIDKWQSLTAGDRLAEPRMTIQTPIDATSAPDEHLAAGRQAYDKRQWSLAYSCLSEAQNRSDLEPTDLVLLAKAAYILGKESEGAEILARAHKCFLERNDKLSATRCSFWLGFTLFLAGEMALASGWLGRATRLLEDQGDCVEKGYLLMAEGFRSVKTGDLDAAYELFYRAAEVGRTFDDIDLTTLSLNGQGRALIRVGELSRGVALLDEAMVAVMADEVSPLVAGGTYCSVIEACSEIFDLRRAQEWTNALDRWCSSQPDQISYHGHCLLRRAELLQLHGEWGEAESEAEIACDRFSDPTHKRLAGSAQYRLGELHRLRGEFQQAEEFYRLASSMGAAVQPGLARLRLSQGQIDSASAAVRSLASEISDIRDRSNLLESLVEIMLEAGDVAASEEAANELAEIAAAVEAPLLHAMSDRAMGSVLLAKGQIDRSIELLRRSLSSFREIGAPYDEARIQVLISQACQNRGDCDTAELELDAARNIFARLGAISDLERLDKLSSRSKSHSRTELLTRRELEVLKLVAFGKTNRDVANELFISEKTVARHLSNIFDKLDLSSRAAAAAYAFKNQLV